MKYNQLTIYFLYWYCCA